MKFIDPKIDFAFKKIFGSEDARDILISFLESLLGLEGDRRIAEVTILDPFLAPKIKNFKYSILDVTCRDQRGVSYIVEMQVQKAVAFLKRIQYNAAKAYVHQIEKGEDYPRLNQVIAVTITDFPLFNGFDHCVSRHESRETVTGQPFLQEILHYFIELPKFTVPLEELTHVLDQWIYFIKFAGTLEAIPDKIRVEPIRHAFEKARVANMTPEEYELYEKAGMAIADTQGAVQWAREEGILIGERRGEQRGIQIGEQRGIQIGEQKGRQEEAASLLLKQIRRKLGQVPGWVTAKVTAATLFQIEAWSENILFAHSFEDVFSLGPNDRDTNP
ncbi:MAG: Rpn family recombination-promoting nuclease/putative transposase [Magnetococcales bacterium]|nr:Rpn family recombination-promoting nuclease/putative transposase [Magnetococcales bacterium]